MQLEDKQLEGPELAREVALEEIIDGPEEQTELPVIAGEEVRDAELLHRGRLFEAMQLILANDVVSVSSLYLPARETEALEFLQAAVSGKSSLGTFVYAEDRAVLFEQALAVLQENITHGSAEELAELGSKYEEMSAHIAELRHHINELAEAQDDEERLREEPKAEGEDEPADKPPEVDPDAALAKRNEVDGIAEYLRAPELPSRPAHVSTLDRGGPEAPSLPDHVSTLDEPV